MMAVQDSKSLFSSFVELGEYVCCDAVDEVEGSSGKKDELFRRELW